MVALKQRSRSSFQNIIRVCDQAGRPLGEGKLPAEALGDVPMTLRACRYPGSRFRHAHPMNLSALQQIKDCWDDCREMLVWLRAHHLESVGSDRVTLSDLWRIARLGQSLPGWMLLRRVDPIADGGLPTAVAAVFKVVIGINLATQSLHLTSMLNGTYDDDDAADAQHLLDHIEAHGLLIGPNQVCAGPRRMIAEVLELLIAGGRRPASGDDALATLIGDPAAFSRYAAQAMRFQAAGYVADVFGHALVHAVAATLDAHPATEPPTARPAVEVLRASLSTHGLLAPALNLTPPQLAGLARSIHRFMAGPQLDGSVTSALIVCLIDAWLQPRAAAQAELARFVGTDVSAPLTGLLATHLAVEHYWLLLNLVGDAALEQFLGHEVQPHALAALDAQLGDTPLRRCFEAIFELSIVQDDAGARLTRGARELRIGTSFL
ncbi:MAG: hypothetical protein HY060_21950 [Proteobacteria bacterium]|nr:hypothetical protein [Pseudomonadota bacterium]